MATVRIYLDSNNENNCQYVSAVKGEVDSRIFELHLTENGNPMSLVGKTVKIYMIKPDNNIIFNECTITDINNGICNITLTSQICAVVGIMKACEIHILQSTTTLLKITGLSIEIKDSLDSSSAIESTSEFTALATALSTVGNIENRVPNTRKINGYDLTVDRSLTYTDVGGASAAQGVKADTAIQTIQGNGTVITPDANQMVNITPANISAATSTQGDKADTAIQLSEKGANNGVATLGSDGKTVQMPEGITEGTFSPYVNTGNEALVMTFSTRAGKYTKIGRKVLVEIRVNVSSVSGSSSNPILLLALPFTVSSQSLADGGLPQVSICTGVTGVSSNMMIIKFVQGTKTASLEKTDFTGNLYYPANLTTSSSFYVQGSYYTDE